MVNVRLARISGQIMIYNYGWLKYSKVFLGQVKLIYMKGFVKLCEGVGG